MKKRQTHYKERGQLEERRGLGVLEKKRHFLARSRLAREREEKIQTIKKLASEANPDEFQYFMYKYKRDGVRLLKKDTLAESKPFELLPEEAPLEKKEEKAVSQRVVFTD
ncbi:U3 small nucleolar RNA-associated protein 11 [Nematocida minor]|uniref:U3 small nucleolar RNA-associated protein 11 n=1 Tax=Nematocida minor TaxID=1912983 RepID=UPI0022200E02|nr:U3 small nucleolar RNA-associated protein 11 [Nematocida minor]KAI5193300.1 U3 small nucleolar RNA-associated protein 11 [Nematocida minor]